MSSAATVPGGPAGLAAPGSGSDASWRSLRLPAVRVQHVHHGFGQGEARTPVLIDNNLEVMPGEVVIMTGPSGCGKTTLLTLIGGLRTLQQGSIQVYGREMFDLSNQDLVTARRNIGFIFQRHNLLDALTAYQNVRMALDLQAQSPEQTDPRIVELLTELKLDQRMHYKPAQLSGGQRQRVAIARALANRPQLILADEPTAALDAESGRIVVELLRKLAHGPQHCTSLIVTHDNRILDVADRIVNMVDGRIKSSTLVTESVDICFFLKRCPVFERLTPDALSQVAERMKKERFTAGTAIIRQGDVGDKFYLIRRGTVEIFTDRGLPTEAKVTDLGEGDFFGEVALLADEPRNATVIARTPLEAFVLGKEDLKVALQMGDDFKNQLLKVYFQRQ